MDFRELVKDLASVFKTRIELRQIGVRDETKILGGIGICGRPLCCHNLSVGVRSGFYQDGEGTESVSESHQNFRHLRPADVLLKNEQETYEYLNKKLPGNGDLVSTPEGILGEVQSVNVLRQLVKVVVNVEDEKEIREYPAGELRIKQKHKKGRDKEKEKEKDLTSEEKKELENWRRNSRSRRPQGKRGGPGKEAPVKERIGTWKT